MVGLAIAALFLLVLDGTTWFMSSRVTFSGYGQQMFCELAAVIYVMLMLLILGYQKVLTNRGEGFLKGFYIGGFMTAYCIYEIIAQFYLQRIGADAVVEPVGEILVFVITMFLIGFNEEMVFRGMLLNLFLDKFGNSKKGILTSVIASGVIFGSVHLTNIFSGVSVGSAIIQAIEAALLGILFAEIYLRSGNIWITVIAHALTDFASMFSSGIFGKGDFIDSINRLSPINFVAIPIFLLPCILLFRKKKLEELVEKRNGRQIIPGEKDTEHMAITALILGILSIVLGCAGYGMGFGVVGMLGGYFARKESKRGSALATAGFVTSVVGTVVSAIGIVVMSFLMANVNGVMPTF